MPSLAAWSMCISLISIARRSRNCCLNRLRGTSPAAIMPVFG